MIRRAAWVSVLLLAPLRSPALAAQAGPAVERTGPPRIHAEPGRQVTAVFRLHAPAGAATSIELTLPRNWPSLSSDAAAPLAPGTSAVRIAGTVVPRSAAAGVYVLRFRLRSGASIATDSLVIDVRERRELAVSLEGTPRFAVSGAEYAASFRVFNLGNARAAVRLSAESGHGFPVRIEPERLDLAPGQTGAVRVSVSTRPATDALAHRISLAAVSTADPTVRATADTRVDVVPRNARGGSTLHTLPVRVGFHARSAADGSGGGVPAEVSASGPLTRGGEMRVDVFYRGRGAASREMGEQEQFSLALRSRRGDLLLGDQFWALSPLTAPGRFGSGAGGRVRAGPVWAEAFSERNRFVSDATRVSAAAVGVGGDRASLAANYATTGDDAILTLRGRARPAPGFGVDAEAGGADGARAVHLHAYGSGRGFAFDARGLEADDAFPGDQRGRSLRQANAAARPVAGLRLHAGYEREARTDAPVDSIHPIDIDPFDPAAPVDPTHPLDPADFLLGAERRSSSLRAGAMIADRVTVERRWETREGEAAGGPWSRAAESWLATGSVRAGRVSLGGGLQGGTVEDRLTGDRDPFGRAWLRAGGSVGRQSLWAGVERWTGTSVETGRAQERVAGSAGVSLQPSPSTRVWLSAQAGGVDWREEPDGLVDTQVEQRLPGGHTLRLRVRAHPWAEDGRRRPTVRLDYAVPLRLPVGRASDAGTVSGRVVDEETGRPISDALVRVGDRAVVTDRSGRWAIAGLSAGSYTVEVDPVSVGVGRVVVRPDALSVALAGGRSHHVEIGVSRAARLEGAVTLPDAAGVEGVVVELRRGEERRRRVTDVAGVFSFTDLEPGRWTLAVVRADLPPHHALERETAEVDLAPGAAERLTIRAVARRREMRIVAGGEVVLGAPASRGAAPAPPRPFTMIPPSPSSPSTTPPAVAAAPSPSTASAPSAPAAAPVREAPRTVAERVRERPWRERGASGFSDWAEDVYVVQPGDATLTAIAWFVYRDGSLWPKLWAANRDILAAPDRLEPGVELLVPPPAPLTAEERAAARELLARRGQPR